MQAELPALANEWNLIRALQKCKQTKNIQQVKRLHAYLRQHLLDLHPILGNYLVPTLVECGSLCEAQNVFDRLPHRNEHSWSSLISGYVNFGEPHNAFRLYQQMQEEQSSQPNQAAYLALLNACAKLEDAEKGWGLHSETTKRGLEKELYLGSTLVDMYIKCGLLAEACQVFDRLPVRDVVSWNALIAGYAEHGLALEVLTCFKQMLFEGVSANAVTFLCSLKACGNTGIVALGYQVHIEAVKRGLEKELHLASTLVDVYTKCGSLAEAHQVFNELPVQDVVLWNTLIAGYTEHGQTEEVLNCFYQMQVEGLPASMVTFTCTLKACGTEGVLDTGQEIHSEVIGKGLEKDLFVGSSLVDMYAKCGSLAQAQRVFEQLPVRNTVMWTALITGYAEHGLDEQVLSCYKQMQLEGVVGDAALFVICLKACGTVGALETGREIHAEVRKSGLERDLFIGHMLVDMYGKCGSVAEGREVFDRVTSRDAASWNALIAGYTEHGLGKEADECLQRMQLEGIPPDSVTFVCSLKACGSLGALETGMGIHAEATKRGMERECHVGSTLVDMYAKCGGLVEVDQVFNKLPFRNAVAWTALLAIYAEIGLSEEVLSCFKQMQVEKVSMDAATFVLCLSACQAVGILEIGREIHAESLKRGLESNIYVGSSLVDLYCKYSLLAEAHQVFERLPARNAVSWSALITGYIDNGFVEEVLECFKQMQLEGVPIDAVTLVLCLKASGTVEALETGQEIHTAATIRGFERDLCMGSTLVDMYGKCSSLAEAQCTFDRLPNRNAVTWTALIAGYAKNGLGEEVLNCLKQMQLEDLSADAATFILCLKCCGSVGALETGRKLHAEIRKSGLETDLLVGNMLIDMYGKCGSIAEGQEVFDKLPVRDVVSWTALINSYGENDKGIVAVKCFEEMREQGVKPNSVTFTCLLAACSHASLVVEGQKYFSLMIEEHGLEPTLDHYACMVGLLARSGHVNEAERFIAAMQCPPSTVIVMALLTACKLYGRVELGQCCFHQLVELNQEEAAAYLLMADIYVSAGRWTDANKVEEMRTSAGAKKKPGTTVIEVNKNVYEFVVGIKQRQEVLEGLETLSLHMKNEGYLPHIDVVSGYI